MIVLTGGCGFVGSNLLAALNARGETDVVICDNFGADTKWRNVGKHEIAGVVKPDKLIEFLFQNEGRIKTLFHLGAKSSTTELDADALIQTNFALPVHLWNWCADHKIRFFYASSATVYGDGSKGFKDHFHPDSMAAQIPLNPHAWSKLAFDRWVVRRVAAQKSCPPQWAGLRFFSVFGPNEYHKGDQTSVAYKLYQQIKAGGIAKLFKSETPGVDHGGQKRDFVYVEDVVDVLLWLYDHPELSGLFNVGTGKARSFNELAQATFAALGKTPDIRYIEQPDGLKGRYQNFTEADIQKLREKGYTKPFLSVEDAVKKYVSLLESGDGYR